MDVANLLKLNITLEKLSMVVVAINLWELKSVKNKICEAFNSGYCERTNGSDKRCKLFNYLIELVPLLGVPKQLSEEIKSYVYVIGGLIFDFTEHIIRNGFDVAFGMNICWTPYGRIDEAKMCRGFLKESSKGQVLEDRFLCLARIYTDINLVKPNMRKIRKKFKKSKNRSLEIFQHCLKNDDLHFATRYFWRELDIMEKQIVIVNCAQTFLSFVLDRSKKRYQYMQQVNTELLLFFLGEMSEVKLLEFITENCTGLFEAFLQSWPHQELCGNIIDLHNNVSDDDGFFLKKYLTSVLSILFHRDGYILRTYKHKNVFHSILQKLLEKLPDKIKQEYFSKESESKVNIFRDWARQENWVPFSIILNDGSLQSLKKDVVYGSITDDLMRDHVLRGSFTFINNFLKYIVFTEEEIKLFKRNKIDWINSFASEGNIKAADRVLNWACDTEKERKERALLEISKFIAESKYHIAEEFVNRQYATEKERKDVKKMLYPLDRRDPLKYCTYLFHKMKFKEIDQYFTWRYREEEERNKIRKALNALDKNDPKEICENLIADVRKYYYEDKIEAARFFLKVRFETEEERRDFKKRLCKSEEYLLEICHRILIPTDPDCIMCFDGIDYLNCFAMLKFFLETEEAVVQFETNNIFTEEFFLKHISNMPFENFEEFLRFWGEMRKKIDEKKKLQNSYEVF